MCVNTVVRRLFGLLLLLALLAPAPAHAAPSRLVLTDVRVGEQAGFDRVVLEFTGRGRTEAQYRYTKKAVLDGSGNVVKLGGRWTLDLFADGTTYGEQMYDGPTRLRLGGESVVEVYVGGTFEGFTQVLIGTRCRNEPEVSLLRSPLRLVVDVPHCGSTGSQSSQVAVPASAS